jgi:hypothetical protein
MDMNEIRLNTSYSLFQPKRIIGIDGKPVLMPGLAWKVPHSWKLMYGSNVDRTLFH